jgi:hypothetical protein
MRGASLAVARQFTKNVQEYLSDRIYRIDRIESFYRREPNPQNPVNPVKKTVCVFRGQTIEVIGKEK